MITNDVDRYPDHPSTTKEEVMTRLARIWTGRRTAAGFLLSTLLLGVAACASSRATTGTATAGDVSTTPSGTSTAASSSDPRVGLAGGLFDARRQLPW